MSAVDVLAVMDADRSRMESSPLLKTSELRNHDEARAAVAELIEAARAVEAWWLSQGMQESPLGAPACIFGIRAALARVQGGAS